MTVFEVNFLQFYYKSIKRHELLLTNFIIILVDNDTNIIEYINIYSRGPELFVTHVQLFVYYRNCARLLLIISQR